MEKPNSFMIVIGTVALAVPATCESLLLVGVKVTAVVPIQPLAKLLLKKAVAWVEAAVSSVVLALVAMNLRPASTPASQACCSRALTTYSRAMSTADPAKPSIGTSAAAMIAMVLPLLSRASRRSRVKLSSIVVRPPHRRPVRTGFNTTSCVGQG